MQPNFNDTIEQIHDDDLNFTCSQEKSIHPRDLELSHVSHASLFLETYRKEDVQETIQKTQKKC